MYFFDYYEGTFFVRCESCGVSEIADSLWCYDYKAIKNWCNSKNIDFPFELNTSYFDLFFEGFQTSEFVDAFRKLVRDKKIKIYC